MSAKYWCPFIRCSSLLYLRYRNKPQTYKSTEQYYPAPSCFHSLPYHGLHYDQTTSPCHSNHVIDTKKSKKRPLVPHILHHHTSLSIPYSSAACYCIQRFKNILQRNTTLKQLGHVPTGGQPIILHAKKTWHPMFCKRLKVDKRAYYNFYVLVLEHRWRKREQGSVHMLPYSLMV